MTQKMPILNVLNKVVLIIKLAFKRLSARIAKIRWLKYFRWVAKILAIGATITGALTAVSTASTTTGIAIGAAGATGTYVSTKGVPNKGYEKIKHVSPISMRANSVSMSTRSTSPAQQVRIAKLTVSKRS